MANVFTGDPDLSALYRLESGALTTDSGPNGETLTNNNGVTADGAIYVEGAASANFNGINQYFSRADALLNASFPLKSSDTTKIMTACGWFYKAGFASYITLFSKYQWAAGQSFLVRYYGGIQIGWGHTGGAGTEWFTVSLPGITNSRWYWWAVLVDGVNKTLIFHLYDSVTTSHTVTRFYPLNTLAVVNQPLCIGSIANPSRYWSGKQDEIVIMKRLLSYAELIAVRDQTYTYQSQVEAYQTMAQVELVELDEHRIYQALAQVELQAEAGPAYRRTFPVPPDERFLQSQTGKRTYPVLI